MNLNQDYVDMFKTLNTANVRYLVVGAYEAFHRKAYNISTSVTVSLMLTESGKT